MARALLTLCFVLLEDPALHEAKAHFRAGKNAFDAAEYERAVEEFQAAQRIRPSPVLDFNIGLAFERLGRLDLAVRHYEAYLAAETRADNRADVEMRMSNLRDRLSREGAYGTGPRAGEAKTEQAGPGASRGPPTTGSLVPEQSASVGSAAVPGASGTAGPEPLSGKPPSPELPFAVGIRLGWSMSGGLVSAAFENSVRVQSPSGLMGIFARAALPIPRLQAEGALVLPRWNLEGEEKGMLSMLSVRAKIGYLVWSRSSFEAAVAAGLDFNQVSFELTNTGGNAKAMVTSAKFSIWGLWLEASARIVLRRRHEIVLVPIGFHFLPGFGAPNAAQSEVTTMQLDMDRGSAAYSAELGYAFRF